MGHEELQTASQILKDRILRYGLCKQPVSTNKADALLVGRKRRIDEIDSQYVGLTSKSAREIDMSTLARPIYLG